MYSHTKNGFCGLDGFGVKGKCQIFTLCFGQTDRQKDRQTDTGKKKNAANLSMQGHKKNGSV